MQIQILFTALAFSQLCLLSSARARSLRAEQQQSNSELKKDERIIGGSEATEDRHSYAVALQDKSIQENFGLFCGGSLIAKDVVLTAAHCQGAPFDVVIGRHDLGDNDGQVIPIKEQLPHPNYDPYFTDNDFMLVFLSRGTTANVDLVKLNDDPSVPNVGRGVTVMGWGDTDIRDDVPAALSDVLMKVQVNIISNNDCADSSGSIGGGGSTASYRGQITQNMLCAKSNQRDSCQGDSGGPLVITRAAGDLQIGIVSWGIGCANQNFPGVYSRVSSAYNWIEREVCKGSQFASEAGFDCSNARYNPGVTDADTWDDYLPWDNDEV